MKKKSKVVRLATLMAKAQKKISSSTKNFYNSTKTTSKEALEAYKKEMNRK